ncbi:MAG TPA: MATE family efflux transporter [Clostridiales bacterium]|nr:MATE family efflux transporter [Clostridiales bacterium]
MKKTKGMDLTEGSIFKKIILFSLPLIATNVLQLLFNAVDVATLGMFVSDEAVAGVGSTGALVNLIVSLFVGISTGANVLVARYVGQKDPEHARRAVGTSVVISVAFGTLLAAIGWFGSRVFLEWMDCDPEVIDLATKYMRIYFLGMPIIMLYNFAASILRAIGDTVRPLIYLVIGGVANILLDVFSIVVLGLDVEGVAIATVGAQLISAILAIIAMVRETGYARLEKQYLRVDGAEFLTMMKIGVPAGLQGCIFSISNVLIQSTINSFGKLAIAGNTIGSQIDGFIYTTMYAVALASLSVVSQNLGAGKIDRVRSAVRWSMVIAVGIGLLVGGGALLLSEPIAGMMSRDPTVIAYACLRIEIIATTYFLCGIMDVFGNSMRGLGESTLAMLISLFGNCVIRILWLKTVVAIPDYHTPEMLYIIYPISWALTILVYIPFYFRKIGKLKKKAAESAA